MQPDDLERYRAMRSAQTTHEPFGGPRALRGATPRIFVCQKHGARRLHYDLRLEIAGTLHSWSVPRGPSRDPMNKRLAIATEPHPLEYADFEGVIPEGNYGAGAMIVWDRGTYVELEPFADGYERGKLLFELRGSKLRGRWQLVKTKGDDPRHWLLIKKPDAFAGDDDFAESSVLSGLSLEELAAGADRFVDLEQRLEELEAPRVSIEFAELQPMLATPHAEAFDDPEFLFELKYDGYRMLARKHGNNVQLRLRSGRDATLVFPEIARTIAALPCRQAIVDGEVVVLDDAGRPDFQRMQRRAQLTRARDIDQARRTHPAVYFVFDLLAAQDFDLREHPLETRKRLLAELLPPAGSVRYCDHIDTQGAAMMAEVARLELEGIVAKRKRSPYRSTRSPDWLKIRSECHDDFVVVGFTTPQGSRPGFSALALAAFDAFDTLTYVGRVGTGFSQTELKKLRAQLDTIAISAPPCTNAPSGSRFVWVEPRFVCEVRYLERSADGLLRFPVFVRLRDDKSPHDCVIDQARSQPPLDPVPEPTALPTKVTISNSDKVFWPEDGYTKGDLVAYYHAIAPWMLPWLEDRPLVLTRYPDGITGKSFFQKHAPSFVPAWMRTTRLWSEHAQREIDYFIADSPEALVYLANLATIPIHIWASRLASLSAPDWCILDLDPKIAPFADVVALARAIKALCDELEIPTGIKTSGSSGLHVLIPLGARYTYEQSKMLADLLAHLVHMRRDDIATLERNPRKRGKRVYIDTVQNGHGKLLAAPWCVRPRAGAPVSMPLHWREVDWTLDPGAFTIRTALERARQHDDPLAGALAHPVDLPRVLEALPRMLGPSHR